MNPFIDEMKKNINRELSAAAKIYCIGIINGLKKYEKEADSEIKDWMQDAPDEYVGVVVEEWQKGKPDQADIAEVMAIVKGA